MDKMRASPLLFAALGLGGAALLFHIIGLSTSHWTSFTLEQTRVHRPTVGPIKRSIAGPTLNVGPIVSGHSGLWNACITSSDGRSMCSDVSLTQLPGKYQAARAFSIIGLLAGVAALALTLLYMFVKDLKLILILATAAAGGAAFSVMVSFATFAGFVQPMLDFPGSKLEYSWSFALCIVAFVLFIAHMVVLLVNVIKGDKAVSIGYGSNDA